MPNGPAGTTELQAAAEPEEAGTLAVAPIEAVVAAGGEPAPLDGAVTGTWPDESAEAAFLAEARERGEVTVPAKAREEIAEETESRPLPDLDALVQRIPAEVRETLEDLFRARFVRVTRVPKKALRR